MTQSGAAPGQSRRRPADFLISYAALRKSWPAEKDKLPRERSSRDIAPCNTVWIFPYFLRRPAGDDLSARFAAARSHVDDIVRIFDYIQVVFNDDNGCTVMKKRLKDAQQNLHIQRMRRKLGLEKRLVAVYKVGYRLEG